VRVELGPELVAVAAAPRRWVVAVAGIVSLTALGAGVLAGQDLQLRSAALVAVVGGHMALGSVATALALPLALGAWSALGVVPVALLLRVAVTPAPTDLPALQVTLGRHRDAWAGLVVWGAPLAVAGVAWVRAWLAFRAGIPW
jgi:hypothetical protein